jgi:HPt (histidine-containing phosphotransfer) domain-containing protein
MPELSSAPVAVQPAADALTRVNLDHLAELREIDPDLVPDLIDIFLDRGPGQLTDIGAAIAATDSVRLGFCAHLFKGSCATVGAEGLAALSLELEMLGAAGSVEGGRPGYHRLVDGLAGVSDVLRTERR